MMTSPVGVVPSARGFRGAGDDDDMAVGKYGEIVMRANHGDIAFGASGGSESGVELRCGHLPDDIVAKSTSCSTELMPSGCAAEIDQEMSVGSNLTGFGPGPFGSAGLICPKHVAGSGPLRRIPAI